MIVIWRKIKSNAKTLEVFDLQTLMRRLIWAGKTEKSKPTFNYEALKST